ncbi:MAG: high-potential iron-sulfur protein [Pseudomonadota bacterium]
MEHSSIMNGHQIARRRLVKRGALLLASFPLLAWTREARAGKAGKADFHYQEHPNEGNRCLDCTQFVPANMDSDRADGACRLVAGPIDPNGWCMAFTRK